MRSIVQFIARIARLALEPYRRMTRRERILLALAIGLLGTLAFVYGIYGTIDATNKYNDLDALPTPDAAAVTQMSQPDLMVVAQVGLAKRDLLARRAQASSAIGAGAALIGLAALIFVNVPEEPKSAQPATADPGKSAETPISSAESTDNRRV